MQTAHRFAPVAYLILILGCSRAAGSEQAVTDPYMGQTTPSTTPVVFAPGLVSTDNAVEWGSSFSPDSWQFYFSRNSCQSGSTDVYYMKAKNEVWAGPFRGPFNSNAIDMEPFVSGDGMKVLLSCNRG